MTPEVARKPVRCEGQLLCPSHAEGRWRGALYREPRPVGNDGLEIEPLWSRHWEKHPCKRCEAAKAAAEAAVGSIKSWDVV